MSDVNCPYCKVQLEIDHSDGYGYKEGEIYSQECKFCGKVFIYTTKILPFHEAYQAPCQNGEEHKLKPVSGYPREFFVGVKRCEWCGIQMVVDKEARKEAIESWEKKF